MWNHQAVQSSTSEEYPLHFVKISSKIVSMSHRHKESMLSTIITALFEINDNHENIESTLWSARYQGMDCLQPLLLRADLRCFACTDFDGLFSLNLVYPRYDLAFRWTENVLLYEMDAFIEVLSECFMELYSCYSFRLTPRNSRLRR